MAEDKGAIFACRPILFVVDPDASIRFYRDVLGFRIALRWSDRLQRFLKDDSDGPTDFAVVARDKVQFMLQRGSDSTGTWLHLDVNTADQLDALHEEWVSRGAAIAEPPALRPWGMYEMKLRDLDDNTFRVSAPPRDEG